ncbi:MAG: hypothetical protein MUF06_10240 [Pirellulaceae bacterium]|nr:hypothetical protein [Pirellulaceae bacterium]
MLKAEEIGEARARKMLDVEDLFNCRLNLKHADEAAGGPVDERESPGSRLQVSARK